MSGTPNSSDQTLSLGSLLSTSGIGKYHVMFYVNLATLTDADQITAWIPGHKGRIIDTRFITHIPVTTGSKASTLNWEIGTVNITGGVLALTSANCTPRGAVVESTAVTALNAFLATDTISLEASSTTAFAEGTGWLDLEIVNDDTLEAMAKALAGLRTP